MDTLWRMIISVCTALMAFIVSRTALAVANIYGWYPKKILAAWIVVTNKRVHNLIRHRTVVRVESPPIVADAPGLAWKRRRDGWSARWLARPAAVKLGYLPKEVRLAVVEKCTPEEKEFISEQCISFQYDMLEFERAVRRNPLPV